MFTSVLWASNIKNRTLTIPKSAVTISTGEIVIKEKTTSNTRTLDTNLGVNHAKSEISIGVFNSQSSFTVSTNITTIIVAPDGVELKLIDEFEIVVEFGGVVQTGTIVSLL